MHVLKERSFVKHINMHLLSLTYCNRLLKKANVIPISIWDGGHLGSEW